MWWSFRRQVLITGCECLPFSWPLVYRTVCKDRRGTSFNNLCTICPLSLYEWLSPAERDSSEHSIEKSTFRKERLSAKLSWGASWPGFMMKWFVICGGTLQVYMRDFWRACSLEREQRHSSWFWVNDDTFHGKNGGRQHVILYFLIGVKKWMGYYL